LGEVKLSMVFSCLNHMVFSSGGGGAN